VSSRTYGYYDPLAQALDAVGERWALLIVRELMSGATRYGEIARRLPGVGTARLADRLRELQAAGLIEASGGYRLTKQGMAIAPAVYALTRFGLYRLRPLGGTAVLYRASFGAFALRALADVVQWQSEPFRSSTIVEDQAFVTQTSSHRVRTRPAGSTSAQPGQVSVRLDGMTCLALATGTTAVRSAREHGNLASDGRAHDLQLWARAHNLRY
jgi:DNA-binding HxlR family transcriptional regulator